MSGDSHLSYSVEGKLWHGVASILWVGLLMAWLITELGVAISKNELMPSADLVAWIALVVLQMMIWGGIVYINLGIHHKLHSLDSAGAAVGFVMVVLIAVVAPLAIGAVAFLAGAETSTDSLGLVGGARPARQAAILVVAGLISVIPAILVVNSVRSDCVHGTWGVDSFAVKRILYLRRGVRIAVMSMGLTIAMFIITTSVARDTLAERSEEFTIEPQHLLLVGGLFTAVLFAMFVYAKSAIDDRAEWVLDEAMPGVDPSAGDEFLARHKTRLELGSALGLGVKAQEAFQNLVVVASPLLGSILTAFISGIA